MNKRFVRVYASLLDYLPPGFRKEFSEEMEQVFAGRMQDAAVHRHCAIVRLFIVELLALPGLWLLAYQRDRRVIKMNDSRNNNIVDSRASWGAALAAALPLAGYIGSIVIAGKMDRFLSAVHLGALYRVLWADVIRGAPFPVIFYLLVLGGCLIAWLKGFPRWSYTYPGWLLIILVSGMGILPGLADPYLRQMGIVGLKDPYLQRIWGPFLVTLLIAILLKPSLKSLKALWHGLRKDWTLASFTLFAILEFWVLTFFDEMPGSSAAMVVGGTLSVAVLVVGALWYMLSSGRMGRIAALLSSATLSMALGTGISAYYWHNFPKPHGPRMSSYDILASELVFMALAVAFLLVPALFSVALNRLFPNHSTG